MERKLMTNVPVMETLDWVVVVLVVVVGVVVSM
jgi:hypothetical protein